MHPSEFTECMAVIVYSTTPIVACITAEFVSIAVTMFLFTSHRLTCTQQKKWNFLKCVARKFDWKSDISGTG